MATIWARRLPRPEPDLLVWLAVVGVAWCAAIWLEVSGTAHLLHHHTIYHSEALFTGGLLLLAGWQVMTAAMMLPSSLPMIRMFVRVGRGRPHAQGALALFLGAYFGTWTVFAMAAFTGDMGLHALVHGWPWLAAHDTLIAAGVLGLAAVYQVSPWKDACLSACRMPAAYLMQKYRPGLAGGFAVGLGHALYCLGCCWALMLVMFSVGVAHLYWMAALAVVMVAEKIFPAGERLRYPVAVVLAVLAAAALGGSGVLSI